MHIVKFSISEQSINPTLLSKVKELTDAHRRPSMVYTTNGPVHGIRKRVWVLNFEDNDQATAFLAELRTRHPEMTTIHRMPIEKLAPDTNHVGKAPVTEGTWGYPH